MNYLAVSPTQDDIERLVTEVRQLQDASQQASVRGTIRAADMTALAISSILLFFTVLSLVRNLRAPINSVICYLSKEDLRQRVGIENILREILGITQSSRVAVGIFHGEVALSPIRFQLMSIIYEATAPGVQSAKPAVKNIPVTTFEDQIDKTPSDHFIKYTRDDADIDPRCVRYLDYAGIHTAYSRCMASSKGIYGMIEIHYSSPIPEDILLNPTTAHTLEKVFNKLTTSLEQLNKGKRII